jgi:hypothetical protein
VSGRAYAVARPAASCALLLCLGASIGCRREAAPTPSPTPQPVQVTDVRVGAGVGSDKRVRVEALAFGPQDTVFVSIVTEGFASRVRLSARWLDPSGGLLEEMDQAIAPAGTAVSEFHLWKPGGFARGAYQVEIWLDGARVGARSFTVE